MHTGILSAHKRQATRERVKARGSSEDLAKTIVEDFCRHRALAHARDRLCGATARGEFAAGPAAPPVQRARSAAGHGPAGRAGSPCPCKARKPARPSLLSAPLRCPPSMLQERHRAVMELSSLGLTLSWPSRTPFPPRRRAGCGNLVISIGAHLGFALDEF